MSDQKFDETQPGGRYNVNGVWVDAQGNPVEAPEAPKPEPKPKAQNKSE